MYGTFIRTIRCSRSLSQRELADISGVSQPNISAIERDRRIPTAETLNRLVVACGYELAAVAGDRRVACSLPEVGWFADEGLPPPDPDDPPDESPALPADACVDDRVDAMTAVLDAADQIAGPPA